MEHSLILIEQGISWNAIIMYEQDQEIPIFCLLNKYVGDWKEGENTVKGHTILVGEGN